MLNDKSILCYSETRIPCQICTICVHGDGFNAIDIVKNVKKELESIGFIFEKLDKLKKFN